jgi:hypothetical protein
LHYSDIVQLLSKSLAEEENAHQLLNQVARPLMPAVLVQAASNARADGRRCHAGRKKGPASRRPLNNR